MPLHSFRSGSETLARDEQDARRTLGRVLLVLSASRNARRCTPGHAQARTVGRRHGAPQADTSLPTARRGATPAQVRTPTFAARILVLRSEPVFARGGTQSGESRDVWWGSRAQRPYRTTVPPTRRGGRHNRCGWNDLSPPVCS